MRFAAAFVAVLLVPGLPTAVCGQNQGGGPNPGVPELKVLDRMTGKWEGHLPNSDAVIPSTRKWVLDGRFLRHEFSLSTGAISGIIYRGYDQKNNRYVMTFLDSTGNASFLTGHWSSDQKILSYEASDDSYFVQKYESYFPDDKTEQWTIAFRGENGSGEITGTAVKKE